MGAEAVEVLDLDAENAAELGLKTAFEGPELPTDAEALNIGVQSAEGGRGYSPVSCPFASTGWAMQL
jgi:hypothetical protein